MLKDYQDVKKEMGLEEKEWLRVVGVNLFACSDGGKKPRALEGWYGLHVPGTILCPWDADFTRIYVSRDYREALDLYKRLHALSRMEAEIKSLLR